MLLDLVKTAKFLVPVEYASLRRLLGFVLCIFVGSMHGSPVDLSGNAFLFRPVIKLWPADVLAVETIPCAIVLTCHCGVWNPDYPTYSDYMAALI